MKYRIRDLRICRARRDYEDKLKSSNKDFARIPDRDAIINMAKIFNYQELQIPLCPHEAPEYDGNSMGWIYSVALEDDGDDLWLVLKDGIVFDWLSYDLKDGTRGPRSISWLPNPYGKGPQMLHLAFLGAANPAVYGLERFDPSKHLIPIEDNESLPVIPEIPNTYLSKRPQGELICCSKYSDVPGKREGTHDHSEVDLMDEKEIKELKLKAENSEKLAREQGETLARLNTELATLRDEKFKLSLDSILATVPEGARKSIEDTANLMRPTNPEGALELAKKLAEGLPKPDPALTQKLSVTGGGEPKGSLDPLYAHNLALAQALPKGVLTVSA